MGLVRIRHRGPANENHIQQASSTSVFGNNGRRERLLLGKDLVDDCEPAEVGCEFVMVEGQICNVPYELYDLPDLKKILSLETWNSCLTEEERFSLATYLPDMDQQTFWLTMKNLFLGESLFFGSPLEMFSRRMRAGFYSLKVTRFREGLQFFQKRGYYHSIKSYHENMSQKFVDMKMVWSDCQHNISVEEKVHIWNNRRNNKPVLLVDLNSFPTDEDISSKNETAVLNHPSPKKTKYTKNEGVCSHVSREVLIGLPAIPKTKGKGVLKIKSVEMKQKQHHLAPPLPSDVCGPCKRPPKGLLKIMPKNDVICQQERINAVPLASDQTSVSLSRFPARISPPQLASNWHQGSFCEEFSYPRKMFGDAHYYKSPEPPDLVNNQQREEFLRLSTGALPWNSQRRAKNMKDMTVHSAGEFQDFESNKNMRLSSNGIRRIGQHQNVETASENSGQLGGVVCASASESHIFPSEHYQGRSLLAPVDDTQRISSVGTNQHRVFRQFLGQSEHMCRDEKDGINNPSIQLTLSGVQREGHMFPITYRRKKSFTKRDPMNPLKQPSLVATLEPRVPGGTDCHLIEKAKPVKIKVKGLSDYNANFKLGLRNGLQHGSPSI